MIAGTSIELVEEAEEDQRRDRAPGNSTRYAPSAAAIAPDAPIVGTVEVGSIATWASTGDDAADEVEHQEPDPKRSSTLLPKIHR